MVWIGVIFITIFIPVVGWIVVGWFGASIIEICRVAFRNQKKWTPNTRAKIESKFGSGEAYLHDDHDH